MARSILISGAGIAGPALAFWLHRHGFHAVVVERAPALRSAGQTIDVRGAGREVLRRMGLETAVVARTTHEEGIDFVGADNRTHAAFPAGSAGRDGFVAEIEILRGELAAVLYDASSQDAEYIFGDHIVAVADDGAGVDVTFAHGGVRRFDALIAADGMRSSTRQLIFGASSPVVPLGQCMGYLTIPYHRRDGIRARWYNAPGGRAILLRPDNVGTTRATLAFIREPQADYSRDAQAQRALVRNIFADAGWEAERVLAALDEASDFYFEEIGQVKLPRWWRGRTALLGDAGYCASPISGMGTSLALVGAYILARDLAGAPEPSAAFAAYEQAMRPYVKKAQKLMPGAPHIACPQTDWGIALLHGVLRIAATPRLRKLFAFSTPADEIALPAT